MQKDHFNYKRRETAYLTHLKRFHCTPSIKIASLLLAPLTHFQTR